MLYPWARGSCPSESGLQRDVLGEQLVDLLSHAGGKCMLWPYWLVGGGCWQRDLPRGHHDVSSRLKQVVKSFTYAQVIIHYSLFSRKPSPGSTAGSERVMPTIRMKGRNKRSLPYFGREIGWIDLWEFCNQMFIASRFIFFQRTWNWDLVSAVCLKVSTDQELVRKEWRAKLKHSHLVIELFEGACMSILSSQRG